MLLIWLGFLVRGAFYCVVLPLWEGFDEYAHFAYVQRVHNGKWLVQPGARATREVERSVSLVPMPWTQRAEPPPHETHESYWRLPPEQRRAREPGIKFAAGFARCGGRASPPAERVATTAPQLLVDGRRL